MRAVQGPNLHVAAETRGHPLTFNVTAVDEGNDAQVAVVGQPVTGNAPYA